MTAGLSPLIWMTGGVSGVVEEHRVRRRICKVGAAVAGVGFARSAEADWLNRAASWVLVMHTGEGSVGPFPMHRAVSGDVVWPNEDGGS